MHCSKSDIPTKIDVPGAVARQRRDFGDADGAGSIGAEYLSMAAGTDLAPLLEGLEGDVCHSPHWGYVIAGDIVLTYANGTTERCTTGDVVYWPPGHSLRVERDAEFVLFSPQAEHTAVMDHILGKLSTV